MTNDSFLFEVNNEKYVFRNPGVGTDLLINRKGEVQVYEKVKHLNLSDDVLYIDSDNGYKISKYIPNARYLNIDDEQELNTLIDIVRMLHESGIVVDHEFNLEERINFYLDLNKKVNAVFYRDYEEIYQNLNIIFHYLNTLNRPKVFCHIDPMHVNFLVAENSLTLLDWEYAGMSDPFTDLANFVVFNGLQDEEIIIFLEKYLQREATKKEITILHSLVAAAGFLWSLWAQYKQSSGEDFGTYGMEQYQYARKYSRIVLEEINNE